VILRDYDVSLPPLTADREQIIQSLLNVARNAAQAVQGRHDHAAHARGAQGDTGKEDVSPGLAGADH
jgi:two-component system nitrogen regulation sensor histidine kinase GlnL